MSRRDDLISKYLETTDDASNPINTHVDNVEVELLVDGDTFFTEVFGAIAATRQGDSVLIVGWTFDPNMTKTTATKLGDILAQRKLNGVHVHIVLNGSLFTNIGFAGKGTPFEESLVALFDLRVQRIPSPATTPPLDKSVVLDFSGADKTGSHHQKVVIIHDAQANDTVAYIGGIDFWPNRDDTTTHPGTTLKMNGQPWGWHDAAVRVRGAPVADAWANFVSRYDETGLLPATKVFHWGPGMSGPAVLPPPNPPVPEFLPAKPASFTAKTPNTDIAVQVLRSRYPTKIMPPRAPRQLWAFQPTGPIRQIYATLHKAIGAAQKYIYIEDQFIADTFDADDGAAKAMSLLPHLLDAAKRNVKIIMLTSGKPEGGAIPAIPQRNMQNQVIDKLPVNQRSNVAIWKLTDLVVHSKIMLIDDVFAAVGSANMHSRSMYGVDQELHVALIDAKETALDSKIPAGIVREWRIRLWQEHLEVFGIIPGVRDALENLDIALGMWRRTWLTGAPIGTWFLPNNPPGFAPLKNRRTFVGPPPMEL